MRMRNPMKQARVAIAVSLFLVLFPGVMHAQQAADTRWLPWLGCWEPAGENAVPQEVLVCIRHGAALAEGGVEILTTSGAEVISNRTLVADGQRHDMTDFGCTGWRSASFSADEQRVYLRSESTCESGRRRAASGLMAIAAPTDWLDVQSIGIGDERMPRVVHYRPAPRADWPSGFTIAAERAATVLDARLLASAELSLADLEEAASRVDPQALVAFLIERRQPYELDADALSSLADAGVTPDVIDVVVAVSYPDKFAIDREAMRTARRPAQPRDPYVDRSGYGIPFGWGWNGDDRYGFGACYGGRWFWSLYCSPYDPYWWGYSQPIIVVRGPDETRPSGRAIRNQGYTRGGWPGTSASDRVAHRRRSNSADRASVSSVSKGTSSPGSASPSGYTSGGKAASSSSGRSATAKPRPPEE